MQNTMLDSTISNSLQLFADKGFKIRVIMRCSDPWFVAKDVADCIEHSNVTKMCELCRDKDKVVVRPSDLTSNDLVDVKNREYTLISESGLYRILAKCNLPKCEPFESWVFDEVLPSIRKTGSYVVTKPEMSDEEIMSRALEIAHRTLALREERIKALEAERDEAIRTKAMIGSRREATAMATASAKSRECAKLTTENAELKDAVGRGTNWRTVAMMKAEWIREFGHEPSYHKLKKFSADLPAEMKPVKDVEEKFVLKNGGEKVSLVNRYHREAWAKYREFEENLRVSAESRRDASNEGIVQTDTDTEIEYF